MDMAIPPWIGADTTCGIAGRDGKRKACAECETAAWTDKNVRPTRMACLLPCGTKALLARLGELDFDDATRGACGRRVHAGQDFPSAIVIRVFLEGGHQVAARQLD